MRVLAMECASIILFRRLLHIFKLSFNYLILFLISKSIYQSLFITHLTWNWFVGYRKWGIRLVSPSGISFGIRGGVRVKVRGDEIF